jgi:hypothetical protein
LFHGLEQFRGVGVLALTSDPPGLGQRDVVALVEVFQGRNT